MKNLLYPMMLLALCPSLYATADYSVVNHITRELAVFDDLTQYGIFSDALPVLHTRSYYFPFYFIVFLCVTEAGGYMPIGWHHISEDEYAMYESQGYTYTCFPYKIDFLLAAIFCIWLVIIIWNWKAIFQIIKKFKD